MRAMPVGVRLEHLGGRGGAVARTGPPAHDGASWIDAEDRQLRRMLVAGFLLCLVPATLASLTGWRWSPWPPGPKGRSSIVGEARSAAEVYVPLAFGGW